MEKIVIGIVIKDKKVLIVKRKEKEGDLLWQFLGGKVENNESKEKAVIREVFEETGIKVEALNKLGEIVYPVTKKNISYFICKYLKGDLYISKSELADALWVNKKELGNYFTTPIYDKVKEYLNI